MLTSNPKPLLEIKLPQTWNELSMHELQHIAGLLGQPMPKNMQRMLVFLLLAKLNPLPYRRIPKDSRLCWFSRKKDRFALEPELLPSLLKKIDFVFDPNGLNEQKMPVFRFKGKALHGPASRLFNLSYQEFIHAEAWIDRYIKTGEILALENLCAILYRPHHPPNGKIPPDISGDKRMPFDEYGYEKRARQMAALPAWRKTLVCLFYLGSREALFAAHPLLQQSSTTSDATSMLERHKKLLHVLSKGDVTRIDNIMKANVYAVFATLENLMAEARPNSPAYV